MFAARDHQVHDLTQDQVPDASTYHVRAGHLLIPVVCRTNGIGWRWNQSRAKRATHAQLRPVLFGHADVSVTNTSRAAGWLNSCVTLISEALTRRLCSTTTEAPRHWRASLQPQRLHCMAYRKTCYSQEHFGELMDVNTRHVIICDPQKGQMGSPWPHAGFRDGKKCRFGRGQRRGPGAASKRATGSCCRHLSNWNATRRISH